MSEVYLAGRGLASALGPDLQSAIAALQRGDVAPGRVEVADGSSWPFFAIAGQEQDWTARARRIVRTVVEESGALAARSAPLFVASSSLDIGAYEASGKLGPGLHDLGEQLAGWLDWKGPVFTVYSACTSAVLAVISASAMMQAGKADDALIVGLELSNRFTVAGFGAMQLLAPSSVQPPDVERQGIVLGEAVAALHLSRRPARWRIAGGANVVDGRNPAGASADAVEAMCRMALQSCGLRSSDIGLIKLQAAGGTVNDAIEVPALRRVFDPLPPLTSLKGAIGHTLGASGAAEIALLSACIDSGTWHAPQNLRYILAGILGFGGGHAAVVLEDRHSLA